VKNLIWSGKSQGIFSIYGAGNPALFVLQALDKKNTMLLLLGVGHDEEPDIEKVPDAVPLGVFKPVTLQTGHDPTLVMFD
jgi:hypothetical protein